jgi:hypothetical protein
VVEAASDTPLAAIRAAFKAKEGHMKRIILATLVATLALAAEAGVENEGWSLRFGGSQPDAALSITVAPDGTVIVVGTTASRDFPTTLGVYQSTYGGGLSDAFVAKFTSIAAAEQFVHERQAK